jgi:hypothetical protein
MKKHKPRKEPKPRKEYLREYHAEHGEETAAYKARQRARDALVRFHVRRNTLYGYPIPEAIAQDTERIERIRKELAARPSTTSAKSAIRWRFGKNNQRRKPMPESITQHMMNEMCHRVDEFLPEGHCFIVLAFPVGDAPHRQLRYASNAIRENAVACMKEWLIKSGHEEDWMKEVGA